ARAVTTGDDSRTGEADAESLTLPELAASRRVFRVLDAFGVSDGSTFDFLVFTDSPSLFFDFPFLFFFEDGLLLFESLLRFCPTWTRRRLFMFSSSESVSSASPVSSPSSLSSPDEDDSFELPYSLPSLL